MGANLAIADLTGAVLMAADLTSADLTLAILTDANLQAADLTDAVLTGTKLAGARADVRTVWPSGFDPDAAGVIFVDREQPSDEPDADGGD